MFYKMSSADLRNSKTFLLSNVKKEPFEFYLDTSSIVLNSRFRKNIYSFAEDDRIRI